MTQVVLDFYVVQQPEKEGLQGALGARELDRVAVYGRRECRAFPWLQLGVRPGGAGGS